MLSCWTSSQTWNVRFLSWGEILLEKKFFHGQDVLTTFLHHLLRIVLLIIQDIRHYCRNIQNFTLEIELSDDNRISPRKELMNAYRARKQLHQSTNGVFLLSFLMSRRSIREVAPNNQQEWIDNHNWYLYCKISGRGKFVIRISCDEVIISRIRKNNNNKEKRNRE